MRSRRRTHLFAVMLWILLAWFADPAWAQSVTFLPYIQLGDNGPFGPTDQMVVTSSHFEASGPTTFLRP